MSKDFMDRMLVWSLEACPLLDEALQALKRVLAGEPATVLQLDLAERTLVTRHLEQIAFDATAWTLWTR
jgi:DNA-binding transcriptional regulator/RsmH inhibitor MraZ